MAKTDRGTKRHCLNCGSKFYDLNRDPIVCPVCGTPFEVATAKASPAKARKEEVEEKETVEEEEPVTTTGPEVISLDEAGAGDDGDDDDDDENDNIPDVDDVEDLGDDDDDTFLEDDDEDDGIGIDVPVDKDDDT